MAEDTQEIISEVEQGIPVAVGGQADWNETDENAPGYIANKPDEFPPEAHTHTIDEVSGLYDALDAKADADHDHEGQYIKIERLEGQLAYIKGGIVTENDIKARVFTSTGNIIARNFRENGRLLEDKYADKDDTYTKAETEALLSSVFRYKGSVETYADLPTEGMAVGDVWNVAQAYPERSIDAGDNVAWTGEEWDALSGEVDLTPYALKADAATDHNHDAQYLKKTGGQVTGSISATEHVFAADYISTNGQLSGKTVVATDGIQEGSKSLADKYAAKEHTHDYLPLSGGTVTGELGTATSAIKEAGKYLSDKYAAIDHKHDDDYAAIEHDHDGTYIKTSGETIVATRKFAIKAPYTDSTSSYRTGYVIGLEGNAIRIGSNANCDFINLSAGMYSFVIYGPGQYVKLLDGSKEKFSYNGVTGVLNVSSGLSEAGTLISDKYAAKTHTHAISEVEGLQEAIGSGGGVSEAKAAVMAMIFG